ncbi:MAG: LytTR family transcriptional regulator [Sphingobacteriales bacterium]|nr:MAG: LytTR family transcriptional regulator [Sphingobacteriales bacterium]
MNLFSLTAPFPAPAGYVKRWRVSFAVALFVTLFLLVFEPFGLSTVPQHKTIIIAGYGLVTLARMALVYELAPALFPGFFREESWVVWKSLVQLLASVFVITAGNLLYSAWLGFFPLSADAFLHFTGITLAVGVFPGAASFFVAHYIMLRKYLGQAQKLNRQVHLQQLTEKSPAPAMGLPATAAKTTLAALYDEDNRLALQLPVAELLCLAAADNYTEVFYLQKGELKKELIRNSLKNMELQLSHSPQLYRCHRSYVVNISRITQVSGNAQGYKLKLPVMKELIPVSRSRSVEFGEMLDRLPAPKKLPSAPKM